MTNFLKPHYIASGTLLIWGGSHVVYSYRAAAYQNLDCRFDQRDPYDVLVDGFITIGELIMQCLYNPIKAILYPNSIRVPLEKIQMRVINTRDYRADFVENKCGQLKKRLNMGVVCLLSSVSLALLGFFSS